MIDLPQPIMLLSVALADSEKTGTVQTRRPSPRFKTTMLMRPSALSAKVIH
jgi:hypothetical protein